MAGDQNLGGFLVTIKGLNAAYVVFAAGVIIVLIAIYLWRYREHSFADLGNFTFPSVAQMKGIAIFGAALIVAVILFASFTRFVWSAMFADDYTSIAPFTISGSDDKQRGLALAAALQAKLAELSHDLQILNVELEKLEKASGLRSLRVYPKFDFDVKIQGVDLGGIFGWLVNSLTLRRALQISVAERGENAIVSGSLRPDGASSIYATVKADNERIVAAVAYSMLRDQLIYNAEEFEALNWADIEQLHDSVMSLARLRRRSSSMVEYSGYYDTITKLISKSPQSPGLLKLGAEVAMKSGKSKDALAFLERAYKYLDSASEDFSSSYDEQVFLRGEIISSCALPFVERLNSGEAPEAVFVDALAPHMRLLRIEKYDNNRDVTIAIVIGVPQRETVGYKFEVRGEWAPGKPSFDNFAYTMGLIVKTVAPKAKLIFVPLGRFSHSLGDTDLEPNEGELQQAVQVASDANPNVILIPFYFPGDPTPAGRKQRVDTLNYQASENTVIVSVAAPDNMQGFLRNKVGVDYSAITAALVASVDIDGRFKAGRLFNGAQERYAGSLWAPGTRIPHLGPDGSWQTATGSNVYAAAVAAAVIANIIASGNNQNPKELIGLLKSTSRKADARGMDVIDQAAALVKASESSSHVSTSVAAQDTCIGKKPE